MSGGKIPRVLSIAGTDPTGGAGIQADLKSIAANGGYGMAVITALVAQNTIGVRSVHVPPPAFLTEQLNAVSDDVEIDAIKIGMLATSEVIGVVDGWLARVNPPLVGSLVRPLVVLDPVMIATSGDRLLDTEAERALRRLLRHADLITPNVPELAVLAESAVATGWDDVLEQARAVSRTYGVIVLAKGGHLDSETVHDALVDANGTLPGKREVIEVDAPRVITSNTHGTGCSLSSALATLQPVNQDWETSLRQTKRWLGESLEHGAELKVGRGNGPVSHFAGLWQRGGIETGPTATELAETWWQGITDIRAGIDALPFIRALADGSLNREVFVWYLGQDALYLRDYARTLSQASFLAPNGEEQAFWAASAHAVLTEEMEMQQTWLVSVAPEPAGPVTTAYLNHLLAATARGYAVLIAALLPCYWLYQDVGERLVGHANAAHPYRAWLETYGDPEFAEVTRRAIALVTRCAEAADPTTREAMWEAFRISSELELAFFAAPLGDDRG